MAQVIKRATQPVQQVARPAVRQAAQPARVAKPADGFQIVNESDIEFATRGGGRGASPEVEALKAKLRGLKIGQGLKLPVAMVIEREINGKNGTSILRTYKGANSVGKMAYNENLTFQTRRDTQNSIYVFRVEPKVVVAAE